MPVADIVIRDVPDRLHAELEARARLSGRSLSDEAKALLDDVIAAGQAHKAAPQKSLFDVAREHFDGAWMTDEEHAEFMRAVEEVRRDPGRPVPDFE